MAWPIETIPDADEVYMRVLRIDCDDASVKPAAFRDHQGMSADWARYATPADTRQGRQGAAEYAVIALVVGAVRKATPLRVRHSPIEPTADEPRGNRAHCDILGLNRDELSKGDIAETRLTLRRMAQMRIPIDDPVTS